MREVAVCISHKAGGVLRPYRMPSDGEFPVRLSDVSCRCRRINFQDIVVFAFFHHGGWGERARAVANSRGKKDTTHERNSE